jgi:two-component system sensor histidine kinase PilS (NtrC family)
MPPHIITNYATPTKQWNMLLIYNIYRLMTITVLFVIFWLDGFPIKTKSAYLSSLLLYLLFGMGFLFFWYKRSFKFEKQILWSGTVDIIVMVMFINALGYLQSGLGAILNASIAVLSILAPGRVAIFFASIASCMLLTISTGEYFTGDHQDLGSFFSTGIYG